MKIINIGVYPPPFGGVSIHLKRLKEYLDKGNIDNIIIDLSKYNSRAKANNGIKVMSWKEAILSLFFHKKAILHFHIFSWKSALIYYILGFKHFTILALAFEAGFKSKATFNAAFKKFTGETPSQFLKKS